MKELNDYLEQSKQLLENYREVIKGINHHIENEGFIPSEAQQTQIDMICERGRELIEVVETLEEFKRQ